MNIKSARVVVILFIYKLIIGYKFIVEKRVKKTFKLKSFRLFMYRKKIVNIKVKSLNPALPDKIKSFL